MSSDLDWRCYGRAQFQVDHLTIFAIFKGANLPDRISVNLNINYKSARNLKLSNFTQTKLFIRLIIVTNSRALGKIQFFKKYDFFIVKSFQLFLYILILYLIL